MGAEDRELEGCWQEPPRAQSLTTSWHPPPRPNVEEWVKTLGQGQSPILSVKGPSPMHRMEVYRWICPLAEGEPCKEVGGWVPDPWLYLVRRLSEFRMGTWNLLWELLDVSEFVVEEPLRGLVDQGFLFTEFYQALWEARFLLQESAPHVEGLVEALIRWMTWAELSEEDRKMLGKLRIKRPLQSDEERLDTLFFLLALARQNGTIGPSVIVFDDIGKAVRQNPQTRRELLASLLKMISAAERWNRLGMSLGLVLGFDPGVLTSLKRYNPKLGKKLSGSLVPPGS